MRRLRQVFAAVVFLAMLFVLTTLFFQAFTALTGCAALQSPAGTYVAADRATYTAVAPEYSAYVAADPALSDDQKARRQRTVETWRVRLDAARPAPPATTAPATRPAR